MSEKLTYVGKDLEAMSFAVNYHRWILDRFRPFLGKRIVEVGAGTGDFSALLLETKPEMLSLIEPSAMFEQLSVRIEKSGSQSVKLYNTIFREAADEIREGQQPDSIIYVNVLEHIEDDAGELEAVRETLTRKGRIFIFVPALSWLYGNFDRAIGHHRRYERRELEAKCRAAGFQIVQSYYFDFAGIFPWWIKYRLLKSSNLDSSAVQIYDKLVVPFARIGEGIVRPPIGKNILLIGEKV